MFGLKKLFSEQPAPAAAAPTTKPPERDKPAGGNYLRREALFDRRNRPSGHLLRLQIAGVAATAPAAKQRFYDSALLDSLTGEEPAWTHGEAFLPLSTVSLNLPTVDRLDPAIFRLCLTLDAETNGAEPLLTRLQSLQEKGFRFGVQRTPQHPLYAQLVAFSSFALIDSTDCEPDAIRQFSAAIRALGHDDRVELIALSVASPDDHQFCRQWHFDRFHGPFAANGPPKPLQTHANPHKVQLLNLMRLVQGDAETPAIAAALKQDPLLTFRILRHLNSAASGLSRQVESIEHALTLLGRARLLRWLAVMLFSVQEPDFSDWLLVESALSRGRLMELLGTETLGKAQADACFLTGIFSCLDRLLRVPMAQALTDIHLPHPVSNALLKREGALAQLLAVAEAGDSFDEARIRAAALAVNLDPDAVNHALLAATSWANTVTEHWE